MSEINYECLRMDVEDWITTDSGEDKAEARAMIVSALAMNARALREISATLRRMEQHQFGVGVKGIHPEESEIRGEVPRIEDKA